MAGEYLLRAAFISIAIAFAARNNYKYYTSLSDYNDSSIIKARKKSKTVFIAASAVAVLFFMILILHVFI